MNIAVVGTFWLTKNFIEAVNKTEGIVFYALFSRSIKRAEEFCKEYQNVNLYDNFLEMLNDKNIDAVYIASPNSVHYTQAKLCLEHGKHVICEKPITVTSNQYTDLCKIADKNNLIIIEAMMNYYTPQTDILRNKILHSGDVVSARLDFSQRSSKIENVKLGEKYSTFSKETCGGALMDLGCYCIHLALRLFGVPDCITAFANYLSYEVDVSGCVIFGYGKFNVVLTFSKLAESRIRSEIICENATFTLSSVSQMQNIIEYDIDGKATEVYASNEKPDTLKHEIEAFIKFVYSKDNEEYLKAREFSLNAIKIIEEIRKQIGYTII